MRGRCKLCYGKGLNFEIQDEIATHELPLDLEGFINRGESRLRLRHQRLAPRSSWGLEEVQPFKGQPPPQSAQPNPEPMQLGRLRLSAQERQQRLVQGLCLYCEKQGHFALCLLKARHTSEPGSPGGHFSPTLPSVTHPALCHHHLPRLRPLLQSYH